MTDEQKQEQLDVLGELPQLAEQTIALDVVQLTHGKHDSALAGSLVVNGQLYPVILRETPDTYKRAGWPTYSIVDGRRRVAALRALGVDTVRAYVVSANDLRQSAVTLTTNAARSSNPLAEYEALDHMLTAGMSEAEIARATGMPKQTIRARVLLKRSPASVLAAVAAGKVSIEAAIRVARLPEAAKQRVVDKLEESGKLTVADVREERQAVKQKQSASLASLLPDAVQISPYVDVAARLADVLAIVTNMPERAGFTTKEKKLDAAIKAALTSARGYVA